MTKCNFFIPLNWGIIFFSFRAVQEISRSINPNIQWTTAALMALHRASEAYCMTLFDYANLAAIHSKRVTLQPKDMHLVHTITGKTNMLNRRIPPRPSRNDKLEEEQKRLDAKAEQQRLEAQERAKKERKRERKCEKEAERQRLR